MADQNTSATAPGIEPLLANIDARLGRIETQMDRLETRMERLDARVNDNLRFLIGLHFTQFAALAAGFVLLLGVIARAQHWI